MTKPTISQSQKRFNESVSALFLPDLTQRPTSIFIKSSSDVGVVRNGGRNGARFAPQSFLSTFKKFSQNDSIKNQRFFEVEVADLVAEAANFSEAQKLETQKISDVLKSGPTRLIHLGGGHDHAYPLLKAIGEKYQQIVVINIDAHADTRTDEDFHSGTPFRQFAHEFNGEFHIFQIGLNSFANSFSTLSPLEKGKSSILWKKDFNAENLEKFFQTIQKLMTDKTAVFFSLDADALCGHEVPGVSAVNPNGLTRLELLDIWKKYQALKFKHEPILGIYELNPLYDTLASISMRTLASFVFESYEVR